MIRFIFATFTPAERDIFAAAARQQRYAR